MRLSESEIRAIKESFLKTFKNGDIYLFGSRVDDTKRGGDIDLYIVLKEKLPISTLFDLKIEFLIELQNRIGEQKIDIVISKDKNRPIEREAIENGIKL